MTPRKAEIAEAFAGAADAYDAAALVQRRVAARLAERIEGLALPATGRCVEIGCGTGLLTAPLLDRVPGDWLVTDIAPTMVARTAALGRADYRVMDGEAPDMAPASCRLIASSLAFQWFEDLGAALARLADCLIPRGVLAFATLGADTFAEWRQAHGDLGLPCGTPAFPTAAALAALWPTGGGGVVDEERLSVAHADGRSFARSLKTLGAHVPASGHRPLAPGAFRRVLGRFDGGCTATYHVLYGTFTKDGGS